MLRSFLSISSGTLSVFKMIFRARRIIMVATKLSRSPIRSPEIFTRRAYATGSCIMLSVGYCTRSLIRHLLPIHIRAALEKVRTEPITDFKSVRITSVKIIRKRVGCSSAISGNFLPLLIKRLFFKFSGNMFPIKISSGLFLKSSAVFVQQSLVSDFLLEI